MQKASLMSLLTHFHMLNPISLKAVRPKGIVLCAGHDKAKSHQLHIALIPDSFSLYTHRRKEPGYEAKLYQGDQKMVILM